MSDEKMPAMSWEGFDEIGKTNTKLTNEHREAVKMDERQEEDWAHVERLAKAYAGATLNELRAQKRCRDDEKERSQAHMAIFDAVTRYIEDHDDE